MFCFTEICVPSCLIIKKEKCWVGFVDEEMVQADLCKQYEFNYQDAVKIFGNPFANRLFPKQAGKKKEVIA
ncbi:MAG: hypothetical protein JKX79_06370 [Labilibaculum sp.]|nr:hypothetical protein [Labilibaculum sp.]